ncbi:MAG: divalent-cation tolerance protein CutA [bacterium]|nr:divalent-cation tolerance protein CutA [bacterium]
MNKNKVGMEFIVVYTTFPHRRHARRLAKKLVKEKLVACANIFKIDSLYEWKGKLEETREYGIFLKTRADLYSYVESQIRANHPYELPCVISWKLDYGSKEFLNWISKNASYKASDSRVQKRQKS